MSAYDPSDVVRECVSCKRCYPANAQFCRDCMIELVSVETVPYVINSRYQLERIVSHGSTGVVFVATDEAGHEVAVKIIRASAIADPRSQDRFRREAHIASHFHHPKIASVLDYGMLPDASAYVVSEYVKGPTLRDEMKKRGKFEVGEALHLIVEICDALDAAHKAGLVHRDLKPESILLIHTPDEPTPTVKIVDFSYTKIAYGRPYVPGTTAKLQGQGHLPLRPTYVSPEQFKGEEADLRSDIFSIGVIAYEMLGGQPPFAGKRVGEFGIKLLNTRPVSLRTLNPAVNLIIEAEILRALEKDPINRQQRAIELKRELINAGHLS